MKLKYLELNDFCQFSNIKIENIGEILKITGGNAQGKTTLVSSITWLLFGEDLENNAKFSPKPNDNAGLKKHYVEPHVKAIFEHKTEGDITFERRLIEKWVTPHGETEETYSGDTTQYSVNGIDVKQTEYLRLIEQYFGVQAKDLKIYMLPQYFTKELAWQDRRTILSDLTEPVSNEDILVQLPNDAKDLDLDQNTIQDTIKRAKQQKTKLTKELEKTKQNKNILENDKNKNTKTREVKLIEEEIKEINEKLKNIETNKVTPIMQKLNDDLQKLRVTYHEKKLAYDTAEQTKINVNKNEQSNIRAYIKELKEKYERMIQENELAKLKFSENKNQIEKQKPELEEKIKKTREEYKLAKQDYEKEITPICETCNQPLTDPKQIKDYKAKILDTKIEKLNKITELGKSLKNQLDLISNQEIKLTIPHTDLDIENIKKMILNQEEQLKTLKSLAKENENNPKFEDTTLGKELIEKAKQLKDDYEKEKDKLVEINNKEIIRKYNEEKTKLEEELDNAKFVTRSKKELEDKLTKINEEINQIRNELQEQTYLFEMATEFESKLFETKENRINQLFKNIYVSLYDFKVDGERVPNCTILVENDGIKTPYQFANYAKRITSGIELICTLQNKHNIFVPIIVDNTESIEELPKTNCQIISLRMEPEQKLKWE